MRRISASMCIVLAVAVHAAQDQILPLLAKKAVAAAKKAKPNATTAAATLQAIANLTLTGNALTIVQPPPSTGSAVPTGTLQCFVNEDGVVVGVAGSNGNYACAASATTAVAIPVGDGYISGIKVAIAKALGPPYVGQLVVSVTPRGGGVPKSYTCGSAGGVAVPVLAPMQLLAVYNLRTGCAKVLNGRRRLTQAATRLLDVTKIKLEAGVAPVGEVPTTSLNGVPAAGQLTPDQLAAVAAANGDSAGVSMDNPRSGASDPCAGRSSCSVASTVGGLALTSTAVASTDGASVRVAVTTTNSTPVADVVVTARSLNLTFPADTGVMPRLDLAFGSNSPPPTVAGAIQSTQFVLGQVFAAVPSSPSTGRRLHVVRDGDGPGCDSFDDALENDVNLGCCAVHDQCFAMYGCSAKSWLGNLCRATYGSSLAGRFRIAPNSEVDCAQVTGVSANCVTCNAAVAVCMATRGAADYRYSGQCYDKFCNTFYPADAFTAAELDAGAGVIPGTQVHDRCAWRAASLGNACGSPATCGDHVCQRCADKGPNSPVPVAETPQNCYTDCACYQQPVDRLNGAGQLVSVDAKTAMNAVCISLDPTCPCADECTNDQTCCTTPQHTGMCAHLDDDDANCGACGVVCDANRKCCGGGCVDLTTDAANCGACGTRCDAGKTCCGGTCVDMKTDVGNCSACGKRCASDQTCTNGQCVAGSTFTLVPPPSVAASTDPVTSEEIPYSSACQNFGICYRPGGPSPFTRSRTIYAIVLWLFDNTGRNWAGAPAPPPLTTYQIVCAPAGVTGCPVDMNTGVVTAGAVAVDMPTKGPPLRWDFFKTFAVNQTSPSLVAGQSYKCWSVVNASAYRNDQRYTPTDGQYVKCSPPSNAVTVTAAPTGLNATVSFSGGRITANLEVAFSGVPPATEYKLACFRRGWNTVLPDPCAELNTSTQRLCGSGGASTSVVLQTGVGEVDNAITDREPFACSVYGSNFAESNEIVHLGAPNSNGWRSVVCTALPVVKVPNGVFDRFFDSASPYYGQNCD